MISLVFLICTQNDCFTTSLPEMFRTQASCEAAAGFTIDRAARLVEEQGLPEHSVTFRCINWGMGV